MACNEPGPNDLRADQIAQGQPPQAWQRLSAGPGAKGERLYDWALVPLWRLQLTAEERHFGHYLLVRRSLTDPAELAYYVAHAVLAVMRAREKNTVVPGVPALRKMLMRLAWPGDHGMEHALHWSSWRRRHRYRACQCHYRRSRGFVLPGCSTVVYLKSAT